jgi:hypothetical protein
MLPILWRKDRGRRMKFENFDCWEVDAYFSEKCKKYKDLKYLYTSETICMGTIKFHCNFTYKTNKVFSYSVNYPLALKSLDEVFEKCIEYIETQLDCKIEVEE